MSAVGSAVSVIMKPHWSFRLLTTPSQQFRHFKLQTFSAEHWHGSTADLQSVLQYDSFVIFLLALLELISGVAPVVNYPLAMAASSQQGCIVLSIRMLACFNVK